MPPARGYVYWADIGSGRKPWLVVSNNLRNASLGDVLAVRITTSANKPRLPSIVELGSGDPIKGRVLCDDIAILYHDDLVGFAGAVTIDTLARVSAGLKSALAL